jgi:nitrile hydratase
VDGIHDLGGMHGFGPIEVEADEPPFHTWWEAHAFALALITDVKHLRRGGVRAPIEQLDPATYLASSYYERWAAATERGLVDAGTLTAEEIDARAEALARLGPTRSAATDPELAALARSVLTTPGDTSGVPAIGRFAVGDTVTVRRMAPVAHHRCPRYVRGVTGVVARVPGAWPPPGGNGPEATYTVRFALHDLWGDDAEPGDLYIDLWERYLA